MTKKFHRGVGSSISAEETKKLCDNYHQRFPFETKFALFGKDIIEKLLKDHHDCEGIKISFGVSDDGHLKPILSAVDSAGLTLRNSEVNASVLCPPHCASESPSEINP